MRILLLMAAVCLLVTPAWTADEKKDAVRELTLKGVKGSEKGTIDKPTVIASADDLAKAMLGDDATATIKKEVNFDKEQVLLFAWAGSGGDKLTALAGKDEVTFQYAPGRTKDLRQHFHAFVIPKNMKWKVAL
jgi:hypothetical protein